jgi:hypothetical protein
VETVDQETMAVRSEASLRASVHPCGPAARTFEKAARSPARARQTSLGVERVGSGHCQVTSTPLLRLKVAGVQNAAALRYHTWYERVPATLTLPLMCTGKSPAAG